MKPEKVALVPPDFNRRVKAKLESDFEHGFRIEVTEHDSWSLPDCPERFADSVVIEAGFVNVAKDGGVIEARLYESRHQSSSSPEATEVHDLTFSLQSPTGEELDHILVDKPRGEISVQGVKMAAPLINVCGLQLRPRLSQRETGEFFDKYLNSSIHLEATQRRFEERKKYHRNEVEGNAKLYREGSGQIIVSHQGTRFQISRRNEVIFPIPTPSAE